MRPIFATLITSFTLGGGFYVIALPDEKVLPRPLPGLGPVPMPATPPAPSPPIPPPAPKPAEKRCEIEKPHRPHEWMDASGQTFHCDGAIAPTPRFLR